MKVFPVVVIGALAFTGCTPQWAEQGESPMILNITGINLGAPLDSDVSLSGLVCPDRVSVRIESHAKNINVPVLDFRGDIFITRYDVRYFRSDGRGAEGVDVPYRISGNVTHEIIFGSATDIPIEVVRRQAKIEPPLVNLVESGRVLTAFAEITLHARSTINQTTNTSTGTLQINFANFADSAPGSCQTQ